MPRGAKKELDPFDREQAVAKKIYDQLMTLDKPSRRRVLGIVNDYAMSADKFVRGPKEAGPAFTLDDEDEV